MAPIIRWVLKNPRTTILFTFMLTLGLATQMFFIVADTSTEAFLPHGHFSYFDKKTIDRIYGISDPIIVTIEDKKKGTVFNQDGMELTKRMTEFIKNIQGIKANSVRSLSTREDIQGTRDGFNVKQFLKTIPSNARDYEHLKERLKAFPFYVGLIVSNDLTQSGIIADVEDNADIISIFNQVNNYATTKIDSERFRVQLSGPPIVTGTLNLYLNKDAFVLNPISAFVMCTLLFFSFRTVQGIWIPFTVVIPSISCAFGTMGFMGYYFTPFSNAIAVILLASCIGDSVHVIGNYYDSQFKTPNRDKREILFDVMMDLWQPIIATSVTTAAGFVTFVFTSPMLPIKEFGIVVAVGVLAAMFFSLTTLPAILILLPKKSYPAVSLQHTFKGNNNLRGLIETLLIRIYKLVTKRPGRILTTTLIIMIVAVLAAFTLKVDYNPIYFFPEDSAVYRDTMKISSHFSGTNLVLIHLDSGKEEGVFAPDFLNRIDALSTEIRKWPQVGNTVSIVDYLKKMNQAFHFDIRDYNRIAKSAEVNSQYFFLYTATGEPTQFDEFIDNEHQHINLRVILREGTDSVNRPFIEWLLTRIEHYFPGPHYVLGGEAHVIYHWMRILEKSVLKSVAIMIGSIILTGLIFYRSTRMAILMSLPVLISVLLTFAFMRIMDIPIGLGTSSFASISIGIGIDYAIHYISFYSRKYLLNKDYMVSTYETITTVGKLIISNSSVVVFGFLVLIFAKTVPPAQIGAFVAIGVSASLAMTLLVLSSIFRYIHPKIRPIGIR